MSTPRSRSGSGTFSRWTWIPSAAGDWGGVHPQSRLPRSFVTQPGSGRRAWLSRHSVTPARAASHSGLMRTGGSMARTKRSAGSGVVRSSATCTSTLYARLVLSRRTASAKAVAASATDVLPSLLTGMRRTRATLASPVRQAKLVSSLASLLHDFDARSTPDYVVS
jgi:hypothetical protein